MLAACEYIGLELEWEGSGDTEVAREKGTGVVSAILAILEIPPATLTTDHQVRIRVNPKFYRPTEVEQLLGDPTKAKTKLGWAPKVGRARLAPASLSTR